MEKEILRNLYYDVDLSIADLTKKLAKSVPSITKTVNLLIDQKIIVEQGLAESTGGRRALKFGINPRLLYHIITVAIDQHYSTFTISDLNQNIVTELQDIPIELDLVNAFDEIITEINILIERSGISKDKFIGIGLSMPGFVNADRGINESYPQDHPLYNLKDNVQHYFNIPTVIENDSRCVALAEKEFGLAKDIDNAMVVNLNWGVGLGMIINGEIFKGESGFAGEFSHIPLSDTNMLCSCGKRGCLEVEASLYAAINNTEKAIHNGEYSIYSDFSKYTKNKMDALIHAVQRGDQVAINNLGRIGYMLGKGIATLIHILNPKIIIISGRGGEIGSILEPQIQVALNEFCIPKIARTTDVQISTLNKLTQKKGTAALVVENFIQKIISYN